MTVSTAKHRPILLAHSYFLRYDEKQVRKMKPYAPLATLGAAAVLRKAGFDVRLFDAMLSAGVEEFSARLSDLQPRIVGIVEDNFNFLTKMCTVRMRQASLEMVRAAKAAGCVVAVNGSDASDHPELYLSAGADAVILQEPEVTILRLAQVWSVDPHAALDTLAGLALSADSGLGSSGVPAIRRTPTAGSLDDLDSLPFPAWDLVDTERYRSAWTEAHGRLSWSVVTSRGCPYRCNWCAKPVFGSRYTQRSPENVVEELRQLRDTVAPGHIWFADDIFGLTARWITEFAARVTRENVVIPFTMQSRVNLMRPQVVADLAAAGAEEVWLGVESGSQKILDAMDKGTRVEQVKAATKALKEHGIRPCWFIQLGYLGEEWKDIVLTRDLIREAQPDDIGVSVSYPLPGTRFHEMVAEHLGVKRNWIDSDELAMMFHGTYPTWFYKRIRSLLHEEVDRGAAFDAEWTELARAEHSCRSVGAGAALPE
jgi:anaerobic magnesium-protoporphyrin IX monomethyl ester cyclase